MVEFTGYDTRKPVPQGAGKQLRELLFQFTRLSLFHGMALRLDHSSPKTTAKGQALVKML